MKNIRLILVAIIVVTLLSTVAFANTSALTFGVADGKVSYDGNGSIVLSIYNVNEVTLKQYAYFEIQYDSEYWAYDSIAYNTSYITNASEWDDVYEGSTRYFDATLNEGSTPITIPANTKICDITFNAVSGADVIGSTFVFNDADEYASDSAAYAYSGSVEVVAAGPSFEDNDYSNAKIVPNTNDIEVGGKKYTNVAVFDGSFSLADVKAGLETGESVKEAGVMFNGEKKATIAVAGDGNVAYTVLFYGITPEQAAGLNINTYYTLTEIAD